MAGFGGAVKLTGESEYRRALKQIQVELKEVSSEMKLVTAQYDKNDNSTEALKAKSEALAKTLNAQKSALSTLESQYNKLSAEQAKNQQKHDALEAEYKEAQAELKRLEDTVGTSSEEYKAQAQVVANLAKDVDKSSQANNRNEQTLSSMRTEMNNLKTSIANTEGEINKTDDSMDDLADSTKEATKEAKNAGEGFTVFKGVLANLASSAISKALSGLQKLGSKLVDVGKEAFNAYSEYEQLTGGVETLFGDSADEVKKYAQNAYKTAGMSANQYMETVTSFSASLLQGLGGDTAKASKIADKAIRDMSDNADKMGTSIEMIQNAYQGFAKQNYTMLDNLKLGYGGTKSEMARLVKESGVLGKAGEDLTAKNLDQKVSYDKIIEAIHVVQQRMGIAGTTAKEASSTIEGSSKSMKASWNNLLVAISSDNGNIKKSIKDFTDSAETFLKNASPRIKKIVEGIFTAGKKLAKQYMPDVYNTVVPVIEKITKALSAVVTFITKNFSTIAPIVMGAVVAFTSFNAVMAISTTVNAVTTAVSGLTTGVGLATKAQAVWNAVMASNPIGAVLTAVAALTTAIVLLASKESDLEKAHKEEMEMLNEMAEEIDANTASWEGLKEAQQKQIDVGMTEMTNLSLLKDELKGLVDENGKVKDGYEERASFITGQLSDALGIEIETVDGVIQEYGTLMDSIDQVMEKKKAQIILDSQESLYKEAINNQSEALRTLNTLQDEKKSKQEEVKKIEEEYAIRSEELLKSKSFTDQLWLAEEMERIQKGLDAKKEELGTIESNYTKQESLLQQYAFNIGQYEKNMELAHAGNYDQMTQVNWNYYKEYSSADQAQKKMLQENIKNENTYLTMLKQLKAKEGTDIYDTQIKASEARLAQNKKDLAKYESDTATGLSDVTLEWKEGIGDQLSALTDSKIEFKNAGNDQVQMFSDGVKVGAPKPVSEMKQIVGKCIKEISVQYTGSKQAGENLIDGVNKGVANQSKQSSVFRTISNFGNKLLSNLKASLKEKSPSKATDEMGQFLLMGVSGGIKKQEKNTLKTVRTFGEEVIDTLNSELDQGALVNVASQMQDAMPTNISGALTSSGLATAPLAQTGGYSSASLIQAFKTAMQGMRIEMGEDGFASFVVDTITNEIYR